MSISSLSKSQIISKLKTLEKKHNALLSKTALVKQPQVGSSVKLSPFYKYSLNIVTIVDKHGKIVDVNRVVKGLKKENVLGTSIYNFMPHECHAHVKKNIKKAFLTKKPGEYKTYGVGPNGKMAYYATTVTPLVENKKVVGVVLDNLDITKQEKILAQLKESEQRLKTLSDSAFEGIAIHQNGKVVQINNAIAKLFQYSKKEIIGKPIFDFIHPSFHQFAIEKLQKKDERIYEMQMLKKGNKIFWAELAAKEIKYNGERARVVAIRDVTKNKEYQDKIKKSEFLYKTLINSSPDGIFIHQKGKVIFANPSAMKIMEASKNDSFEGKSIFNFLGKKDVENIKKRIELINQQINISPIDIEIKTFKNNHKKIEVRSQKIEYNEQSAILVIFHDQTLKQQLIKQQLKVQLAEETAEKLKREIAERNTIEEKLYKQSAKLNSIFEGAAHIIWTQDKNGKLVSFNNNFKKYFENNYGVKVKVGLSLTTGDAVTTEEYNNFWQEKLQQVFNGKSQHFEAIFFNKKGAKTSHEIFITPIKNDEGIVVEASAIAHDTSEKKAAEEQITQSLKEKEVLLKEVHHRVKNNLQLVSSILNLQSSYINDEKIVDILKDSQNRIKSMSFIHESLYQTKDFTNINFSDYIAELSKNLIHSYAGYDKSVKLTIDVENVFLNLDLAIPCGLIVNEILSNSLKYAFDEKATEKELVVKMGIKKEYLILKLGDNGVGLPSKVDFKNTNSLGLQIVNTLVEQLNGTIELDKIKKGTNFTIQFKHNQIKNRI